MCSTTAAWNCLNQLKPNLSQRPKKQLLLSLQTVKWYRYNNNYNYDHKGETVVGFFLQWEFSGVCQCYCQMKSRRGKPEQKPLLN